MQSPVYKAAQTDDTYPEVYLFQYGEAGEQGWYISTKWFYTLAQKKQAGSAGRIKAYSPGVHDGLLELLLDMKKMKKVYMPYWCRKTFPELLTQSTIEHKTEMVDALQNALGSKKVPLVAGTSHSINTTTICKYHEHCDDFLN